DEVIREHLSIHLGRAGYPVITAASGREALELIAAERCEAVIADWEMPDINGPALCRRIRSSQRNRRLYVLMFTVRDECDDVVAGLNS
ncbi:response regulator, partial [Acinetobacter baumannii]